MKSTSLHVFTFNYFRPAFFFMTFDDSVQLLNKRLILLFPSKMSIELKTYKWDDVDFDS